MKTKILFPLFFILFFYTQAILAESQDLYAFNTSEQQIEFDTLLKNFRCLVCQNQDLNDSHSEFSETLRQEIHQWILEGKSQQEILDIVMNRYGDFILFEPPVQKTTYLLWYGPFAIFTFAIIILCFIVYSRKHKKNIQ